MLTNNTDLPITSRAKANTVAYGIKFQGESFR